MKIFRIALLALTALPIWAQSTVYLRASGPAAVPVTDATNATPVVIGTYSAHGYSIGDTVTVQGLCAGPNTAVNGNSWASAANGTWLVASVPDSTHFSINTLLGSPVAGNGPYVSNCSDNVIGETPGAQWTGKVTAFTTAAQPTGLAGPNGVIMNELSSTPSSLVLAGCPGACVITVVTSYNPLTLPTPAVIGNYFTVIGTTSTLLNTGIFPSPITANTGITYTMASVSSTGFVSVPFAASISNGNYTTHAACGPPSTPNGTIGGTQNCTRVSLKAIPGNGIWDGQRFRSTAFLNTDDVTAYKFLFDGGGQVDAPNLAFYNYAAEFFLVDPTTQHYLDVLTYTWNHMERSVGVSFFYNSLVSQGTGQQFNQNTALGSLSLIYAAVRPYLSAADKATGLNKIYNDTRDPAAIASTASADIASGHNYILATNTAQAGTGTTITLASADTQPNSYYNGTFIIAGPVGAHTICSISGYVASTKVATCLSPGWSNGAPSNGTPYIIYATMLASTTAQGATATITGIHTTWNSGANPIHVGDEVIGAFAGPYEWSFPNINWIGSIVTAVNSDTSLTVINAKQVSVDTVVPSIVYNLPAWKAGDSGLISQACHWGGGMGCQPNIYPTVGGSGGTANIPTPPTIQDGGNNASEWCNGMTAMGFAGAADDSRAGADLTRIQSNCWDYTLRHYWNYISGNAHSGSQYNSETIWSAIQSQMTIIANSVPTFPDMGLHLQWMKDIARMRVFQIYPDFRFGGDGHHAPWPAKQGNDNGDNELGDTSGATSSYISDANFFWNPNDPATKYLFCLLKPACNAIVTNDYWTLCCASSLSAGTLIYTHQNQAYADYRAQPANYLFHVTNATTCASLTGWPCPADFKGSTIISLSDWSRTATHLYGGERSWYDDHDHPQGGALRVYRVGELLGTDAHPNNDAGDSGPTDTDEAELGDMVAVNGGNVSVCGQTCNTYSPSKVPMWACPNSGTFGCDYGDGNGQFTFWCADRTGQWGVTMNYYIGCVIYSKPTGGSQFIFRGDMISPTVANNFEKHVLYAQNGESDGTNAYPEGSTSNTSGRIVVSVEDGNTYGGLVAQYGIIGDSSSPQADYWTYDGTSYTNSQGHADRTSHGCGASQGTNVSTCNLFELYKIMDTLTDTTFSRTYITPDSNWYGVQAVGTLSSAVMMLPLGGVTHAAMTGFLTTHSGTAQYVFGGFTAGTYAVTINGTPVAGSPFAVVAGDNSISFLSTAGSVSINGSPAPPNPNGPTLGIGKSIGIIH